MGQVDAPKKESATPTVSQTGAGDAGRPALPKGPHSLTREQVAQSQRQRLIAAVATTVGRKGYPQTSVADIIADAGVSRSTFYQFFDDKEAAFCAAFEEYAQVVAQVMVSRLTELNNDESLSSLERIQQLLIMYIQLLSISPETSRAFLVESFAAGPQALSQREASLAQFEGILIATQSHGDSLFGLDTDQEFAARFFAGAVSSLVTSMIGTNNTEGLNRLPEQLADLARAISSGGRNSST